MSFAERICMAERYEHDVMQALIDRGWFVEPFGQALLSEDMRRLLRGRQTGVRYLPDMAAVKDGLMVWVDAKASVASGTGNHAVETASTDALLAWQQFTNVDVFYAFPHDTGHSFVPLDKWVATKRSGPRFSGKGSGTPFDLGRCSDICRYYPAEFEHVLGLCFA